MKEDMNLDMRSLIEGHTDVDSLLACTIRSVVRLQEMLIEYAPEIYRAFTLSQSFHTSTPA